MGTTPCSSTEHNLDFLTTRKTPHGVMRDELGLETEVGEVLLNLPANKGAEQAEALGLAGVNFDDFLSMKRQ